MIFFPKSYNGYLLSLPYDLKRILNDIEGRFDIRSVVWIREDVPSYLTQQLSESFRDLLFELIDDSNKIDTEIYKKAYIDRRHFSKIRSDEKYHPSFKTVTLLAFALELSTQQYERLLNSAAYSLPNNKREFIVIRYCFDNHIYDIKKVNAYLYTACKKSLNNL